jgi:hypothetical protein
MLNATSVGAERKRGPAVRTAVRENHFHQWCGKNIKFIEIGVKSQADVVGMW